MGKFWAILTICGLLIPGCQSGISQQDILNQYASLDKINDLSLRQQKASELDAQLRALESQRQEAANSSQAILNGVMIYRLMNPEPAYQPIPVFNYFGWSK